MARINDPVHVRTVPYTVYAGADETGLVHDHLWALIERGAALLQVCGVNDYIRLPRVSSCLLSSPHTSHHSRHISCLVSNQVPPAYLLRHVLSLDQHLFPPRPPPLQRPLGSRHTKYVLFG